MTDLEVLKQVIDTLENIEVPAKYVEKIGIPISNSVNLLKALDRAVKETIKRKEEESAQQPSEDFTNAEAVPVMEEPEEPSEPDEPEEN